MKISTGEHCIKNLTNISYVTLRDVFSIIRIMITYTSTRFFFGGKYFFNIVWKWIYIFCYGWFICLQDLRSFNDIQYAFLFNLVHCVFYVQFVFQWWFKLFIKKISCTTSRHWVNAPALFNCLLTYKSNLY